MTGLGVLQLQQQGVVISLEQQRHFTDQFVLYPRQREARNLAIKAGQGVVEQRGEVRVQVLAVTVLVPNALTGIAQRSEAFGLGSAQTAIQQRGNRWQWMANRFLHTADR